MSEIIDAEVNVVETQENQRLELVITKEQVGILEWDFDGLNKGLDFELAKYKGAEITKDNVNDAKKVRTNLNALSKAINDKKIQVKNTFNAPYLDFESKVKILLKKIDQTTKPIDAGIKALEEQEKQRKKEEINNEFINYCDLYSDAFKSAFKFEFVFDDSWLNKSCSTKKWTSELHKKCDYYYSTFNSLSGLCGDDESKLAEVETIYLTTGNFDLQKTTQIFNYTQQIRQARVLQPKQQNVSVSQEKVAKITNEQISGDVPLPKPVENEQNELKKVSFMVMCNKAQLQELAKFMNERGIKFKQI